MMRVVYFAKTSEQGPSSRYRINQFLPHLEAKAIQCSVRPLFGQWYFTLLEVRAVPIRILGKVFYALARFIVRAWDLVTMGRPDLVVIEGQLFPYCPPWVERVLVWMGQTMVIEFDDAIYLTRFHRRKMSALVRMASGAIVGNQTLAQYARSFTRKVIVVPTVVDTDRFRPAERAGRDDGIITIVWAGLAYNLPYLDLLVPTIRELQRTARVRFRVVSSRPPRLRGIEVEFIRWSLGSEVEALRHSHIGVMPLPDTEWARGKCGLKLLQYMAVGMPAVASPVGVNREIINHGENGLLASTSEEWQRCLMSLCADDGLRRRLGIAARRTVEERYSLDVWGPRLASHYLSLSVGSQTLYLASSSRAEECEKRVEASEALCCKHKSCAR